MTMITFTLTIQCDGFVHPDNVDKTDSCSGTAVVEFEFVGFNGTIPLLEQQSWPEGWTRSPQPDGCRDKHYCPKHREQVRGAGFDDRGYAKHWSVVRVRE
jgi:hypothetical protein